VFATVSAEMITGMGLRFGYLIARHLVAGVALLGRSDAAKDVEILQEPGCPSRPAGRCSD